MDSNYSSLLIQTYYPFRLTRTTRKNIPSPTIRKNIPSPTTRKSSKHSSEIQKGAIVTSEQKIEKEIPTFIKEPSHATHEEKKFSSFGLKPNLSKKNSSEKNSPSLQSIQRHRQPYYDDLNDEDKIIINLFYHILFKSGAFKQEKNAIILEILFKGKFPINVFVRNYIIPYINCSECQKDVNTEFYSCYYSKSEKFNLKHFFCADCYKNYVGNMGMCFICNVNNQLVKDAKYVFQYINIFVEIIVDRYKKYELRITALRQIEKLINDTNVLTEDSVMFLEKYKKRNSVMLSEEDYVMWLEKDYVMWLEKYKKDLLEKDKKDSVMLSEKYNELMNEKKEIIQNFIEIK